MIDLNWHKDDYILAGCAGDVSAEYVVPVLWEKAENQRFYTLSIHSLYGGHCEFDIVLERANSIKLAARFLNNLLKKTGIKIADISGGVQNNVIPVSYTHLPGKNYDGSWVGRKNHGNIAEKERFCK